VRIERHGREPDRNLLAAAGAVYSEAFAQAPYHEGDGSAEGFYDRVGRYASRAGFRLALCRSGPDVVGLALSVRAFPGDWWRDHCAATLGPQGTTQWLEPSIREVVHVAVSPQHQRRSAGRLLTEDALDDRDVASVVLSCHPEARPAQSLYLACGFELLTTEFRTAPGQLGYWLMARRPVCHAG
jgi:ribosomal protein S18 acetylase RimI-like enzyme